MKNALRAALAGAVALACMPATAGAQTVEPVTCESTISNQTVGDVYVPYQADCTLKNVKVTGDLFAEPDAGSVTLDNARVSGDVTTDQGDALTVKNSRVLGSVESREAGRQVLITGSVIASDVHLFAPSGGFRIGDARQASPLVGNVIGGSLKVELAFSAGALGYNVVVDTLTLVNNFGAIDVTANAVGRTIDCSGSDPSPTGRFNVAPQKLDQCAGL